MSAHDDFEKTYAVVTTVLPKSWNPRRPQPEWDRYFGGKASITEHFGHKTDRAKQWLDEAMAFSGIVLAGFESEKERYMFAHQAENHILNGPLQFED